MAIRPFAKHFMIGVSIAATLVIVLLQVFPEVSRTIPEKTKEPQATEQGSNSQIISAPADAVPGGTPMQVNEADRKLIDTLENNNLVIELKIFTQMLGNYLSVLLKACISPNAP